MNQYTHVISGWLPPSPHSAHITFFQINSRGYYIYTFIGRILDFFICLNISKLVVTIYIRSSLIQFACTSSGSCLNSSLLTLLQFLLVGSAQNQNRLPLDKATVFTSFKTQLERCFLLGGRQLRMQVLNQTDLMMLDFLLTSTPWVNWGKFHV